LTGRPGFLNVTSLNHTLEVGAVLPSATRCAGCAAGQQVGLVVVGCRPSARPYQRNPHPGRTGTTSRQGRAGLRQPPSVHPAAGLDLRARHQAGPGDVRYDSALSRPGTSELIRGRTPSFSAPPPGTRQRRPPTGAAHQGSSVSTATSCGGPITPETSLFNSFGNLAIDPETALRSSTSLPAAPSSSPAPPRSSGANPVTRRRWHTAAASASRSSDSAYPPAGRDRPPTAPTRNPDLTG
jgi:hypothetical protein